MLLSRKYNRNNKAAPKQDVYPYMFQTSGFSRIDEIRAEIESQPNWDYAPASEVALKIQDEAARKFGVLPPYSKEQFALRKILYVKRAGSNIATYAWGLYSQSSIQSRQYA